MHEKYEYEGIPLRVYSDEYIISMELQLGIKLRPTRRTACARRFSPLTETL